MQNFGRKLISLLPAIAWALAIIAVAWVFQGTPAANWLVTALTGIAFLAVLPRSRKSCS